MKIKEIHIENFRSIKSETIVMDKNCLILLGKNEAGKSNVLKAIAAIFGQYSLTVKDQRKKINNEKINNRCIYATFEYVDEDVEKIEESLLKKYATLKDLTFKNGKSLKDYIISELPYVLYEIRISNNTKAEFLHSEERQMNIVPEKEIYQNGAIISFQPQGNKIDLFTLVIAEIGKLYSENPYKCIFWRYDNNLLLPDQVPVNQFTANPSQYKSLENIFIMCNRANIAHEFKEVHEQDGDYVNLLDQVSKEVTKVFRKIWKDFKSTSIELTPDGGNILIKVSDNAKYSFADRSDGFKKFISILLNLSTQSRSGKIGERDIIIIDEPDQSLYPTSAKYLRDELLRISEVSRVIYATHSQYMIDSECLDRHLIVEKNNDITTIHKETGFAPYSDDELLRRAIGCSIFECLQEKNIIFEGWLDKELFKKFLSITAQDDFRNIGKTFLHGISGVETLASILILANKKFIIVADSDKPSSDKRKDFEKNYSEYKDCWLAYGDIEKCISTLEDFVNSSVIEKVINENGYPDFKYNNNKNAIENIETCIKDREEKQKIKRLIIDRVLKKEDFKSSYIGFVNAIREKMSAL
ncbi:MAG: AAA family ATPase [Salinivirgaceae bacterium]|nr:AAA family ATPase [Salinivirgaceae bacterium]MBR4621476.1 AAA family ATPase [Salinivirgaceae bacterium]MBR6081313.1 AAA family ATPase [Salinivirgaceae bacterium]